MDINVNYHYYALDERCNCIIFRFAISRLVNLEYLNVKKNEVFCCGFLIKIFKKLSHLKRLSLQETSINDENLLKLKIILIETDIVTL